MLSSCFQSCGNAWQQQQRQQQQLEMISLNSGQAHGWTTAFGGWASPADIVQWQLPVLVLGHFEP
jgi:hypothetical protein